MTFLIIIGVFAGIALLAFLIYKIISGKNKTKAPSEKEVAKEELNRLLEDVDDEETSKKIQNYKDEDEK